MPAVPESADAGKGRGFIDWIDRRFPLTKLWKEHLAEYYAPKNFNFWYFFGSLGVAGARQSDRHGDIPDDALQTFGRGGVRFHRIHHARRRLGLADPLHAHDRRVGFLHRRLSAHVPRR